MRALLRKVDSHSWGALLAAVGALALGYALIMRAQAAAPFATFPPSGTPACTLAWDATNKLLTTQCTVGATAWPPISYNPRLLEVNNAGVLTMSFGGVAFTYTHNLAADPLRYTIGWTAPAGGTSVALVSGSSTIPFLFR